jgi:hypothetical protein
MQRYLRLLNYEYACKVIDFINTNDKNDYANITVGGVSIRVSEQNWDKVEEFIKTLGVRYEVGTEAPYKVEERIVNTLKNIEAANDAIVDNSVLPDIPCYHRAGDRVLTHRGFHCNRCGKMF